VKCAVVVWSYQVTDRGGLSGGALIRVVSLLGAAAIAVGVSVPLPKTIGVALIAVALLGVAWAVYVARSSATNGDGVWSARPLSLAVVLVGLSLFAYTVLDALSDQPTLISVSFGLLIVAVAWAAVTAVDGLSPSRFALFLLLAGTVLIGVVLLTHHLKIVNPTIDVPMFQTLGAKYLLAGVNPYGGQYPDIYGELSSLFYGEGLSVDGVLQFGFPYLPAALLVVTPFEWVFGDVRLVLVVAVLLTSFVVSRMGRGRLATAAAVCAVVLAPSSLIVNGGWIEPLLGLGVSVVALSLISKRALSPIALGVVLATKQYAVLLLPAFVLAMRRPIRVRELLIQIGLVVGVVAVVTIPFLVWNPQAFVDSVVVVQFKQPLRPDSLSATVQWLAPSVALSNVALTALPLFAYAGSLLFAWRFVERGGPTTFGTVGALTLGVFFLFSKQAFANYYFLVVVLLLTSVATERRGAAPIPEVASSATSTELR